MTGWVDYFRAVGSRITWNRGLVRGAAVVLWVQMTARLRRRSRRGTIAYFPQPAGPWYTMPLALAFTGIRLTPNLAQADLVMMFDDRTQSQMEVPETSGRLLNAGASDVSKAYVGKVFESVFGYPISVDPQTHVGSMVEKSDENGVHDGRLVTGPLAEARPGYIYQHLAESTVRPGVTEDLRCVCLEGQVVVVFRKEKATNARFSTTYLETTLRDPKAVFSETERECIARFCNAVGLDFGSIDILRDYSEEGRLYIVDVNKTCMPVLSMPIRDLKIALADIGAAVETMVFPGNPE